MESGAFTLGEGIRHPIFFGEFILLQNKSIVSTIANKSDVASIYNTRLKNVFEVLNVKRFD